MTLLDHDHLYEMIDLLGPDQTRTLIRALIAELKTAPAQIARLLLSGDAPAARSTAHGLRGVALGLGCQQVAALAGLVESGTSEALPDLRSTAADTIRTLEATLS